MSDLDELTSLVPPPDGNEFEPYAYEPESGP